MSGARLTREHGPDARVVLKRLQNATLIRRDRLLARHCQPATTFLGLAWAGLYARHISRILCDYVSPGPLGLLVKECEKRRELLVTFGMLVIDSSRGRHRSRASGRAMYDSSKIFWWTWYRIEYPTKWLMWITRIRDDSLPVVLLYR